MAVETFGNTGSMLASEPTSNPAEMMVDSIAQFIQDEKEKMLDFSQARTFLNRMISDWVGEETLTEERRKIRKVEVDVEAARSEGKLAQDETIVPIRRIDMNIRREQPPFIAYLKQSRRLAVFKLDNSPGFDSQLVEEAFTNGMTYEGWETPIYKTLDGAQTHGWDSVEVVFDETKPLHVGHEHIGHDRLIFNKNTINLQYADRIIRRYDITISQLVQFTNTFGFNKEQAKIVLDKHKDLDSGTISSQNIKIYKVFFRLDGIVQVAWFADQSVGCNDWLKAPAPLYLGIRHQMPRMVPQQVVDPMTGMPMMQMATVMEWMDSPIQLYPVFILPYAETEEDKLMDYKGRVFLDQYIQEAMTYITSGYVNGIGRASNLYASLNQGDDTSAAVKQIASLESGVILNKAVNFMQPDYPDPSVVNALQYLDTSNSAEVGQIAFAVNNRQDSRKTATEIATANQQNSLLNSVQLTLFSTFIRQLYSFSWQIAQSQALQGKINFLVDSATGQPRLDLISPRYTIRAAGDIDVVQRAEKLSEMKQFWPIVSMTPLAMPFLVNMLKVAFPDDAGKYELQLQQGQMEKAILQQMTQLLMSVGPDILKGQSPENQQNFQMLIQQAQQVLGAGQQQQGQSQQQQ